MTVRKGRGVMKKDLTLLMNLMLNARDVRLSDEERALSQELGELLAKRLEAGIAEAAR